MKSSNMKAALLKRGREPAAVGNVAVLPVAEMPMVLMLEQLRPNPDNPRTTRNPKYEEIKSSIHARGLDSVPKVTKNPDSAEDVYIFSDGGNTRYAILSELYQETGDERFRRIQCIFKPWPGRLKCVIGHLAENEMRGDLSFIEKALGVAKARSIYEEQFERKVTQQELADLLTGEGYRVTQSNISRMEYAVTHLFPHLSSLFYMGLSRTQVLPLINLYSAAEKGWKVLCQESAVLPLAPSFEVVFASACSRLELTALTDYSLEYLKDELMGELVKALPDPTITWDRWLIELDPAEQQRRQLFGSPEQTYVPEPEGPPEHAPPPSPSKSRGPQSPPATAENKAPATQEVLNERGEGCFPDLHPAAGVELQPDMFGGEPVLSGEAFAEASPGVSEPSGAFQTSVSSIAFAAAGLEPVADIWHIPSLQDDIEHLQDMAFRLAFELAEALEIGELVIEDKSPLSSGFRIIDEPMYSAHSGRQLLSLFSSDSTALAASAFSMLVVGAPEVGGEPLLDDIAVVKYFRLIRILRRMHELQRLTGGGE
ncbi:ParB family protein [Klebsiella pneumoniae]|uniref:ParB family protein n=1 Tax=Klebsiella pneumoniae TaxID=573 RepID=UPI0004501763|nr:ParB family protein [Klebsiella pneumoniae]EIW9351552.1 transcriptional regulator [Klebsiella pneumoniae]EIW9373316.1 transcriptional regulator [Klebsiella pneumoniae]EKY1090456.1 hypothetical protein [Klebsiella pneumoniae]EWE63371.1 integrating conjugative element, PFGI_1 class, ParB family protein [Klebsiella pneumoniae BIDMC 14]KAB7734056.1 transcriptional regulator [Klebsiella pneumoniae]